jgi:TetR/AcrR family transcriptional repressor of nem operon
VSDAPRRVGATNSKKRAELLDCVERLMVREGYAAVTYRAVAAAAGVTPGLVQYYFPTLDEVFIAAIRRRSAENLERLETALAARPDEPLRVLWEYSQEEATAALTTEFLALGNHRKSIASEIAEVTEQVRRVQLEAIARQAPLPAFEFDDLTPSALLFLVTGIPKLIRLERGVGLSSSHDDVSRFFDALLGAAERTPRRRRSTASARADRPG